MKNRFDASPQIIYPLMEAMNLLSLHSFNRGRRAGAALRALVALPEDPGLIPSTSNVADNYQ